MSDEIPPELKKRTFDATKDEFPSMWTHGSGLEKVAPLGLKIYYVEPSEAKVLMPNLMHHF